MPPCATAATTAAPVQLAGVPLPTTLSGLEVSSRPAPAGIADLPSGLPAGGQSSVGMLPGPAPAPPGPPAPPPHPAATTAAPRRSALRRTSARESRNRDVGRVTRKLEPAAVASGHARSCHRLRVGRVALAAVAAGGCEAVAPAFCACDTGGGCQLGCSCDSDCSATCGCNLTAGCDSACSCDLDCSSHASCNPASDTCWNACCGGGGDHRVLRVDVRHRRRVRLLAGVQQEPGPDRILPRRVRHHRRAGAGRLLQRLPLERRHDRVLRRHVRHRLGVRRGSLLRAVRAERRPDRHCRAECGATTSFGQQACTDYCTAHGGSTASCATTCS